ncbi:pyruvoyl-dependent arginine decarboxylase [Desulfuromonas acetoxidans]|uniref:pyruvoyl-dependent arginine decarboxylase n=1 Tax=Desulfuromonas acetoxidans TaxID=891 RepID=UPI00292DFEBC|nr:pyruvoyl-dependent arginine decarboxylase [Desulfuromonas acetoxidans]
MANNTVPQHYFTCACGQGESPVSAHYLALAEAGLADRILLEARGFLPPDSALQTPEKCTTKAEQRLFMARIESATVGEVISAAIAVAYPENPHHGAPVIPVASTGHKEDIEAMARSQAQSAVEQRGDTVKEIQSLAVQVKVSQPSCALACVVLTPSI